MSDLKKDMLRPTPHRSTNTMTRQRCHEDFSSILLQCYYIGFVVSPSRPPRKLLADTKGHDRMNEELDMEGSIQDIDALRSIV
jgi:hypothetical protein